MADDDLYAVIDPVEAEFMRAIPRSDWPEFTYRDVHPKHRPVWGETVWNCTCGRYASDRLEDMQGHSDLMVKRDEEGSDDRD